MLFCTSFSLIWAHSLGSIQLSGNLWTCHWDMIYNIYNIRYKQYILSPWFHKINQINLTVYYGNLSIVTGLTNHITFFYVKSFVKICISVDRFVFFASFSVFFFFFFCMAQVIWKILKLPQHFIADVLSTSVSKAE